MESLSAAAILIAIEELCDDSAINLTLQRVNNMRTTNERLFNVANEVAMMSVASDASCSPTGVEEFFEHTIPLYTDEAFRSHFRMYRSTFEV